MRLNIFVPFLDEVSSISPTNMLCFLIHTHESLISRRNLYTRILRVCAISMLPAVVLASVAGPAIAFLFTADGGIVQRFVTSGVKDFEILSLNVNYLQNYGRRFYSFQFS